MTGPHKAILAGHLGLLDLKRQPASTACQMLAFAAVIGPLLILFGLKSGVIDTLTRDLLDDPENRRISELGEESFTAEWIAALAQDPGVGFIAPHTRSLAAKVDMLPGDGRVSPLVEITILASGPGDPFLPPAAAPPEGDQVWLSTAAALELGVGPGDPVRVVLDRNLSDFASARPIDLTVAGVIDLALWRNPGALIPVDLLVAIEQWRDGFSVPERGWDGLMRKSEQRFASFRLYARDLEDVRPLTERLTAEGLSIYSNVAAVDAVQGLDRSLSAIFAIIAGATGIGYLGAFAASLWDNVLRKRRDMSLLRLQGVGRGSIIGFPLAQALTIASGGWMLGAVIFLAGSAVINAGLGDGLMVSGEVCRVEPLHLLAAFVVGLAVALAAAVAAAVRIASLDPAEGFQHA